MKKRNMLFVLIFIAVSMFATETSVRKHLTGRWMASFNTARGFQVYYLVFNTADDVTYSSRVYNRAGTHHYENIVATGKFVLNGMQLTIRKKFVNEPNKIITENFTIVEINEKFLKIKSQTGFIFSYKKLKPPYNFNG